MTIYLFVVLFHPILQADKHVDSVSLKRVTSLIILSIPSKLCKYVSKWQFTITH